MFFTGERSESEFGDQLATRWSKDDLTEKNAPNTVGVQRGQANECKPYEKGLRKRKQASHESKICDRKGADFAAGGLTCWQANKTLPYRCDLRTMPCTGVQTVKQIYSGSFYRPLLELQTYKLLLLENAVF